jgi:hypothetical protein
MATIISMDMENQIDSLADLGDLGIVGQAPLRSGLRTPCPGGKYLYDFYGNRMEDYGPRPECPPHFNPWGRCACRYDGVGPNGSLGDLGASTADKAMGIVDTILGMAKGATSGYVQSKNPQANAYGDPYQAYNPAAQPGYGLPAVNVQWPNQQPPTFWQKNGTTIMVVGGVVVAAGAIYALTRPKPYRAPAMAGLSGYRRGVHRGACIAGGCRRW